CDPTQLYRQLRRWKLDTKGNDVKGFKPLDEKRKRIIEFVDIRQNQTDVAEIAKATGFSWEFVKEVLCDREIKLLGRPKGYESERKRQVLLVNYLRAEGLSAELARRKAGIKAKTYSHWAARFNLRYKKPLNRGANVPRELCNGYCTRGKR
ncbi:MAG TPA: hypothetical protein VK999_07995, partial [Methylotenera sp.]|nr:hypothetical protein [Methylotenera sp.]